MYFGSVETEVVLVTKPQVEESGLTRHSYVSSYTKCIDGFSWSKEGKRYKVERVVGMMGGEQLHPRGFLT